MESIVTIMGVGNAWRMVDKDTNEVLEGKPIYYLVHPFQGKIPQGGLLPTKTTLTNEQFHMVTPNCVPGIYKMHYDMVPDSKGKPQIKVVGYEYQGDCEFDKLFKLIEKPKA